MKDKKFQYSKIITLLTFIVFCGCVVKCFLVDISSAYDLTVYAAIVTTSGMLCATSFVWYLKNSQAEKVAKIKADTYRIISEERFKYNEKMLKLQKEYDCLEEDIVGIEENSPLDELEQEAMDSLNSSIDNAMEEAIESIDIQNL